eukprot:8223780-Ditylum_brightwellii.AAC.1
MDKQITNMYHVQNTYLYDMIGILGKDFKLLDHLINAQGSHVKMSFYCWLLTIKIVDESMQLFLSVNVDPNNIYYFCTSKVNKEEVLCWIDALPEFLCQHFLFEDLCLIQDSDDPDQCPMHAYRDDKAEDTNNVIQGFASVFEELMDTLNEEANEGDVVVEEVMSHRDNLVGKDNTNRDTG